MNNQETYKKWNEHQEKNNLPHPTYSVEAYTQETINSWKAILQEESEKYGKYISVQKRNNTKNSMR